MLNTCDVILAKYKELRAQGLSKDDSFEMMLDSRKKTILEIIEIINDKD